MFPKIILCQSVFSILVFFIVCPVALLFDIDYFTCLLVGEIINIIFWEIIKIKIVVQKEFCLSKN